MSLASLYETEDLIEKKYLLLIMGFSFTVISIFFSLKLFPEDPGIVAVTFVSLMSLRVFVRFFDNISKYKSMLMYSTEIFKLYIFLFIGVFLAFLVFSYALPDMASTTFFKEQMRVFGISNLQSAGNSLGNAMSLQVNFYSILFNNLRVLFFCIVVSFFFGFGALFLVLWNASVWSTLLGYIMRSMDLNSALILFVSILPHAFLEASSYIFGAIAGIVLSSMIEYPNMLKKQNILFSIYLILFSIFVLIAAAFIEVL